MLPSPDPIDFAQALIALAAAVIALVAVNRNFRSQRIHDAEAAWQDYLKLCIANPEFASPMDEDYSSKYNYQNETFDGSREKFHKYTWFVSYLLTAVGVMKRAHPSDKFWDEMLTLQVSYHKPYIRQALENKKFVELSQSHVLNICRKAANYNGHYLSKGISGLNDKDAFLTDETNA